MSAWTALQGNFFQYLDINLGTVHKITAIETAGRAHSGEFVSEFHVMMSNDGKFWRMYLVDSIEKAIYTFKSA